MSEMNYSLAIPNLQAGYRGGSLTPEQVCADIKQCIQYFSDYNIWISLVSDDQLQHYLSILQQHDIDELPLYGVPFAIKDNIDLEGTPTTAACEAFGYVPDRSARVVQLLMDAGAIPIGKTNLDQFATGLVGTRSHYGAVKNAFDPAFISGGSSAGSAVAVALGQVSFALGTDTAGSGRVPAMLNNIYGLKPSRGLLSMSGVVPACRSLDCPSIFSLSAFDASTVFNIVAEYDSQDSYSRKNPYTNTHRCGGVPTDPPIIAVPVQENLEFFGNTSAAELFSQAISRWRSMGATVHPVNIEPLINAAKLLYEGGWVAERYVAIEQTLQENPAAVHPVVSQIVMAAGEKSAADVFKGEYQIQEYRQCAEKLLAEVDFLLTPTAPTTYTIEEVLGDPVTLNANMGYYTNYMNLLDLCGIAVPAGQMKNGQYFGVTLIAPTFSEQRLLGYSHQWQQQLNSEGLVSAALSCPPTPVEWGKIERADRVQVAVCGAHLSGMPLNWQLTERGGQLQAVTQTSAQYRLYALAGGPPYRPGLIRDEKNGSAIDVEVWSLPATEFGSFVANIPSPLGIGRLQLANGSEVSGFICEPYAVEGAEEITQLGGWRSYIANITD